MHSTVKIGDSSIMFSDGCGDVKPMEGFSLSLTVPNAAEAEKAFTALSKGGQIQMPMTKTFFSPAFGCLKDQFGVGWMVYVPGGPPPK
jgi:PhnB protein